MSCINDIVDCTNCGHEANSEFYLKTGEEIILCPYCGYYKSISIKNNKRLEEVEEDDWEIIEIKKPYAAYRLKYNDSDEEECGTLITYEDFNILKTKVFDNINDVESFVISRFKSGQIIEKVII